MTIKKKVGINLTERIIKLLTLHSERSNINKSRIIELALNSYIEPNVEDISIEEIKEILFRTYYDIARLTKLRDELYLKLQCIDQSGNENHAIQLTQEE